MLISKTTYEGEADLGDEEVWEEHGEHVKSDDRGILVDHAQFGRCASLTVKPGDNNVAGSGTNGERAEVMTSQWTAVDGDRRVVAGFVDLTGYKSSTGDWNFVQQFHASGAQPQPQSPWAILIPNNRDLKLRLYGGKDVNGQGGVQKVFGPIRVPDKFSLLSDILFHSDPAKARAIIEIDGKVVIDAKGYATNWAGRSSYFKCGQYRGAWNQASTIVFSNMGCWKPGGSADPAMEARAFLAEILNGGNPTPPEQGFNVQVTENTAAGVTIRVTPK